MSLPKRSQQKSHHAEASGSGSLLAIVGPTASGKSGLAHRIALATGADILCADSRTIYRGMDIGTAKPTVYEQSEIRYYGLDLVAPDERYSAADFVSYAKQVMREVQNRNKPLILVGGSGMYIDALLFDYSFRQNLHCDAGVVANLGTDELLAQARALYPQEIIGFDVKNTRRLRELLVRGPASTADRAELKYDVKILGITVDAEGLQGRIIIRTKEMLNQGFVQEVESLLRAYSATSPGLKSTGYSQVVSWLEEGGHDMAALESDISMATRRLAKKQRTWFGRNAHIAWDDDMSRLESAGIGYLHGFKGTMSA